MALMLCVPQVMESGLVVWPLLRSLASLILLTGMSVFVSMRILPKLMESERGKNSDLFVLTAVSFCLCMALLSEAMGLSLELGTLLAGLSFTWRSHVNRTSAAIDPLSHVFGGMFFASIGMLTNPVRRVERVVSRGGN